MIKLKPLAGWLFVSGVLAALAVIVGLVESRTAAAETTIATLARDTHFHGLAVDPGDPSRLYLATHHGLYVAGATGIARQVSESKDDFMGFTPHPTDPAILFASGHPAGGGNLGFIASRNGGRSWSKLSAGVGGPVDFHQMDVSKADPQVLYGVYGDLQKSKDGGHTWARVGQAPDGLIGLAASSRDPETLYAATRQGLLKSADGGRAWKAAYVLVRPATMVHVTGGGEVYAFVVGTGLIRASEEHLRWQVVSNGFGNKYILHFAAASGGTRQLYAVTIDPQTRDQAILVSYDHGIIWSGLGASRAQ
ncbi:MAG: WD40/YVTN/BNR-like repeat-containing protein [Rhodospirillales bacterium]